MIEGLHFDFTGDELKFHLGTLAVHHNNRAAQYRESLAKLGGSEDRPDDIGISNSGRQDLKQRIDGHAKKAREFEILSAHLIAGETYRLSDSDLRRIELTAY